MKTEVSEKTRNYEYINRYWEILGACAWKEYEAHGRGALVIGAFDDLEDPIFFPLAFLASAPLLKEFAQFAEEYDPWREVVLLFLKLPSGVSAYRGGIPDRGTPPELYEKLKSVLNEN